MLIELDPQLPIAEVDTGRGPRPRAGVPVLLRWLRLAGDPGHHSRLSGRGRPGIRVVSPGRNHGGG